MVEFERLEAEKNVVELNDQLYKMKYDDVIRHKYVQQSLLANTEDSKAKPKNYVPYLLPRRKNLDYIADIPHALDNNIPYNIIADKRSYYNT